MTLCSQPAAAIRRPAIRVAALPVLPGGGGDRRHARLARRMAAAAAATEALRKRRSSQGSSSAPVAPPTPRSASAASAASSASPAAAAHDGPPSAGGSSPSTPLAHDFLSAKWSATTWKTVLRVIDRPRARDAVRAVTLRVTRPRFVSGMCRF